MNKQIRSVVTALAVLAAMPAHAAPSSISVGYQPMVSTGLAAGQPFEAWIILDKDLEPSVQGYAVPVGATLRFKLSHEFGPMGGAPPEAVLLNGWPQKAINARFRVSRDQGDPRAMVIDLQDAISAAGPEQPGLKAIHVRTSATNPPAGDYAIVATFTNAGALSGSVKGTVHITPKPVPNIAAYNQLHEGRNEDWQRLKKGADAALPIDFLVTLPEEARSAISIGRATTGDLAILRDGEPIGTITTTGVPLNLEPQKFGPGFARLGIIRVRAKAGTTAGVGEIKAALDGGTQYVIHVIVE